MIVDALVPALVPVMGLPAPTSDFWYGPVCTDSAGDVVMTPELAASLTAVFTCVRIKAETMGFLPLHLMEREGDSVRVARDHPLFPVLHRQPNHWQTSRDFFVMMQAHLDLRGNAYALIKPGARGAVDQLIPLNPTRMQVFRVRDADPRAPEDDRRIGYLYRDARGIDFALTQDQILHVRGLVWDGLVGVSPIAVNRRQMELSWHVHDHGLKFYRRSARPSGVIQLPEGQTLQDTDRHTQLRESWQKAHSGADLFSVAILEDGAQWEQVGLSNEDIQWLETIVANNRMIAQIYRMPLNMIQDWEKATYANFEQATDAFSTLTMAPEVVSWEQALGRDLLDDPERFFFKFVMQALLRGDSEARGDLYQVLWGIGALSINEIRGLEDFNPIEGGDEHFVPLNFQPLSQAVTAANLRPVDQPNDTTAVKMWAADAANRIAGAERRDLLVHAPHHKDDPQKFGAWARGHWAGDRHAAFATKTISPLCGAGGGGKDGAAEIAGVICKTGLATVLCDTSEYETVRQDGQNALKAWRERRAKEVAVLILKGISS